MTWRSTRCIRDVWPRAVLAAALALGCGAPLQGETSQAGHQHTAAAEPRFSRSLVAYQVPAVDLVDMDGRRVGLEAALGGPGAVMLQFIFTTCPGVCPVLSAAFSAAQEELGPELERVRLVSISIDPEHDTPQRLRAYAARYGVTPSWRFLTGSLDDVVRVQKAFDAYRGNKMRHLPTTYLRVAPDDPWLRLDGFTTGRELVAEYRRLAAAP